MPLRLQATEDDVYHLMDLKEQYFIMTAICSVAEGISAYFFIYQKRCWDLVYLCTALALAIILLLRQAIKISRRIMEGCGFRNSMQRNKKVCRITMNVQTYYSAVNYLLYYFFSPAYLSRSISLGTFISYDYSYPCVTL